MEGNNSMTREEFYDDMRQEIINRFMSLPETEQNIMRQNIDSEFSKIAIKVFDSIEKKKWKTALNVSKKARNKILYNLINYLYLIKPINGATFYDYISFINQYLKKLKKNIIHLNLNLKILCFLEGKVREFQQWSIKNHIKD